MRLIVYFVVIMPLLIFIICWSKVAVGFVFGATIMYFIFRTLVKDCRFLTLYILCFLFIFALFIFINRPNIIETITTTFQPFAYEAHIKGGLGMWGHYIVLSLMTMLFIGLEICKNQFGKTIWIETIAIVSILAFLPASIMNTSGISYFSEAIEVPSLILLCGHNYINIDEDSTPPLKQLIYFFCLAWCIWVGFHHMPCSPLKLITNKHNSNLSSMLLEIRKSVGCHPADYAIYLDADSILSQVFFDKAKTAIFVSPAMTGVGVINATYGHDDGLFFYDGSVVGDHPHYGLLAVTNGYLSFEDAIITAKQRGKRFLIRLTDIGYEVVPLY